MRRVVMYVQKRYFLEEEKEERKALFRDSGRGRGQTLPLPFEGRRGHF